MLIFSLSFYFWFITYGKSLSYNSNCECRQAFVTTIHTIFFCLAVFLTTDWPWRGCYLDSGCKCACPAAELYFNETPLSCSCEALFPRAMFDKSLCKECAQTPAPLKPLRATGHGNCVFRPRILGSANCYFSQQRACVTVSFHCPLWPLYLESCNIMRGDNGDFIRGEAERLELPRREFVEQAHYVSCKTHSPPFATVSVFTSVIYPLNDNTQWL